ncbi:MAG: hypothetical protein UW41_C0002G0073 [Candidatus Collierbacteria bacterium GW2011_GWC2_44_18]|uniref:Uncharacterized protein n=1 Tax=Candidatus Collierbacteria bacterium GW2011_GWC2_44_18 TaxID=1618392 RepID=A0A0G1K0X8_9BACT|nr:MAG: hypothetical protein UW16_C0010G0006 [Microgenomates group bacterium GW2011_GWC1_44_10]KKT49797.1 MAG: hypothetical protein UW41_C0002G0073 [Candidatus Collierbacteria bacterium GW2011_GWC2_44_18]
MEDLISFIGGQAVAEKSSQYDFLVKFFKLVSRCINAGETKLRLEHSKIKDRVFFLKMAEGGYLAIKPDELKIFEADEDMQILKKDFALPYENLIATYTELRARLVYRLATTKLSRQPLG